VIEAATGNGLGNMPFLGTWLSFLCC